MGEKMKKTISILLCIALLSVFGTCFASAAGRIYYFDAASSDANEGTASSPWRSVDGHDYSIGPGTQFLFRCGGYVDPRFAGTDMHDAQSFALSDRSPLIGKGIAVEDELTEDFFGNPLQGRPNIGCYAGAGVPSDACERHTTLRDLFVSVIGYLRAAMERLFH